MWLITGFPKYSSYFIERRLTIGMFFHIYDRLIKTKIQVCVLIFPKHSYFVVCLMIPCYTNVRLCFHEDDMHVVSNTLRLQVWELAHLMKEKFHAMNNGSAFSAVNVLRAAQHVFCIQTQEHYHYFISASSRYFVKLLVST